MVFNVSQHQPDCRIFVKRLIVPNFELLKSTPPRIVEGHSDEDATLQDAFNLYYPKSLRGEFIDYYKKSYSVVEIDKQIVKLTQERDALINEIKTLESIQPLTIANSKKIYTDTELIFADNREIRNLQTSRNTIRAIYEPCLLEITLGVVSTTTSVTRNGIGSATVNIKLPLDENGINENILRAVKDAEMWNLDKNTPAMPFIQSSEEISGRELNIFKVVRNINDAFVKVDRKQCELLPGDMIQIWFSKRYISGTKPAISTVFPNDYVTAFTGFIKGSTVSFGGGQSPNYSIMITAEDIGHILRISRANIDPALDPRFRLDDISVTALTSKLQSLGDQLKTGAEIIRDLVVGRTGFWGGASQMELIDDMKYDNSMSQPVKATPKDTTQVNDVQNISTVKRVQATLLPWQFNRVPLNLFQDLLGTNAWDPYITSFKSAFKLWESEYKYRWDICKEIADVMEYEFYADNFGVINYHPPLYNWNPANVKYFIENKEILNDSHNFNETGVVTNVEVVSQPEYGVLENTNKILSTFAAASPGLVYRYGVRFRSKNIPFLSGTEPNTVEGPGSEAVHTARMLYARAWLNRRNAEVQSATVDIPGTPEIFLCNVVAFVDDINELTQKLASPSIVQILGMGDHLSSGNSTGIPGIAMAGLPITSTVSNAQDMVNSIKVYYVSGVSHKYTQGTSFITTLTLTHGRTWGTKFNVGYSFSEKDHDALYESVLKVLGQPANVVDAAKEALDTNPATKIPGPIPTQAVVGKNYIKKHANPVNTQTLSLTKTPGLTGMGSAASSWLK